MRSLGTVIVVYTESQRKDLLLRMPNKLILAAPNAIYSAKEMRPVAGGSRRDFIYVGRLVKEKKVDLLLQSFAQVIHGTRESSARLIIVGEGPEKQHLLHLCSALNLNPTVDFRGHVSCLQALRGFYETALASVSPGGVGLALTQSLGFGVPMILADNERHGPEFEAAAPSRNVLLFEAGNPEALADAMRRMLQESRQWIARAESISAGCRSAYSAEAMADKMFEAIELAESCS